MKKVLLIGDSIRVGYDKAVKKSLEGKVDVYFPDENCRFACYVLRYLNEYQYLSSDGKFDIVHWNAGHWDTLRQYEEEPNTPIDIYAYYIDRICARIKKLFPDAKVVFATSTRVTEGLPYRRNEDIRKYNAVAIEIVKKYGFLVNDLYAISEDLPDEALSDDVHYYTPMGTEALSNAVISCILRELNINEVITYNEELHTDTPVGY
ncbi:MAG: SGNH/GDSL hydrolase family protein [Clostridia bacterium]|nr:SGNH/GDSL hydrolase family protein [Clostridia bacterium]